MKSQQMPTWLAGSYSRKAWDYLMSKYGPPKCMPGEKTWSDLLTQADIDTIRRLDQIEINTQKENV